ncbi:type I-E CRISPR-associated protein Cas6/Cse3/CasE [Azospirillum halopraeferens]|uniref:type I-E CRISPR-associated protein Cas6/Cse3/CasE n=1 Tax=Azospirillum halopraeferens TaxID=34010 RepID=UPI00041D0658|nr:type I-E CRISPR-associated protein Cas6/Cse3/CasE [Azospirillum halopraeferens]
MNGAVTIPDADAPAATGSEPLWESRVVLTPRDPAALRSILGADMRRSDAQFAHRMIWTLFPGAPAERRQGLFLFHVERNHPFTAIVRSRRTPQDGLGGVWTIERTRPFAPVLEAGQRLRFRLRAVANHWIAQPGAVRGRRVDVVTAAWDRLAEDERTPDRLEEAGEQAALAWLARQGQRCGFAPRDGAVAVLNYDLTRLRPARRGKDIRFGALTFEGMLTVTDPVAMRTMLADGVGGGRAYGNGLMQIAPAP